MKFFTFGFLVLALAATSSWCLTKEEGLEMAKLMLNDCKIQEGGTDADIELIVNMNYPTTREGNCMVACAHEKMGIVRSNIHHYK